MHSSRVKALAQAPASTGVGGGGLGIPRGPCSSCPSPPGPWWLTAGRRPRSWVVGIPSLPRPPSRATASWVPQPSTQWPGLAGRPESWTPWVSLQQP